MDRENTTPANETAAEQSAEATQGASQETPPAPTAKPDETQLGDAGKKALEAERRARRSAERDLAAANQRLQEIADAEKTEIERATEAAAKAQQDADAARAELVRERIARQFKLADADIELLHGDEDQMTRLAERLASSDGPRDPLVPNEGGYSPIPSSAKERAVAAQAAGDSNAAMALKVQQLAEMRHPK